MTVLIRDNLRALYDGNGEFNHPPDNAGLALARYQRAIGDKNEAANALNATIGKATVPDLYRLAFARWLNALWAMGDRVAIRPFEVQGRMIVGLGAESVREASVTLLRAYGVPVIPGSALKGLARHYAETAIAERQPGHLLMPKLTGDHLTDEQQEQNARNVHAVLFGDTTGSSFFDYFDAWWIPPAPGEAGSTAPLQPDVITVHHPRYYGEQGTDANGPWDFDDPNPNPFLSARGRFLIAVRGQDKEWATYALGLLELALAEWGIGAKTSSGYGRLTRCKLSEETQRIVRNENKNDLNALGSRIVRIEDDIRKSIEFAAMIAGFKKRPRIETWAAGQDWGKKLIAHWAAHPLNFEELPQKPSTAQPGAEA